jgi:hypothetical protein
MPTKLLYLASALVSTVAAVPLGCGSLDGHTGTPGTLATVQGGLLDKGGLLNPSGRGVLNDVRVAVVWRNIDAGGQGQVAYSVSQDLPVQPVFPSSFVVQLDGPPPAAALGVLQGLDVPIALGVVVAYEDLNGDGKLDLVPSDAGAFIDRIVGANENLYLFYIGGPVPPQATQNFVGTPKPGYNLLQALTVTCGGSMSTGSGSGAGSSSSGGSGSGSAPGAEADVPAEAGVTANDGGTDPEASLSGCTPPPPEWLPMTAPYDLTVSSDPKVNQIMCQNGVSGAGSSLSTCSGPRSGAGSSSGTSSGPPGGASSSGTSSCTRAWDVGTQGTPPGGYPSPTDPGLMCLGPTSYLLQHCVAVNPICGTSVTTCTGGAVALGSASRPPDWPCP